MSLELSQIATLSILYLSLLFCAAWLTDKGWIPRSITRHPLVYVLSLGVYTSAWAFYGAVGIAHEYGFVFLAYYLGICGAFLLAPVLLSPLLRITREYQLSSLADLFAFRFRSSMAGTLTTVIMLFALLPLVAMQIQAVADSIHILSNEGSQEELAFSFCVIIILFTMAFGTRRISSHEKHHGLVVSIAIESAVKLIAMLVVGGMILFQVFDGPKDLQNWLITNQAPLETLRLSLDDGPWRTMLLIFFAAAIVMPDMFHMAFTENQKPRNLGTASWAFPLYLLLMSLPIPLLLWGGVKLQTATSPEYFVLGIGLDIGAPWLSLLTYLGAMSAASGLIIVTTLALSAMVVNHLILPVFQPDTNINIYRWLSWTKRILIAAMIFASYGFYRMLSSDHSLAPLVIVAFVACLQFLPGVLSTIYWPHANRYGFCAGLIAGSSIWFVTMFLPLVLGTEVLAFFTDSIFFLQADWHWSALISLTANIAALLAVSLATELSSEEKHAAEVCSIQSLGRPSRQSLKAQSPREFQEHLTGPLGAYTAQREVSQALYDLGMSLDENRPYALRRLRDRIEANLSGLMGPSVARDIINRYLPYEDESSGVADINFVENQIEDYQHRLTGLALELDNLRRYHRQTLQHLPMAICSLGEDGEVMMWNQAMEEVTGIPGSTTVGSYLGSLQAPWNTMLSHFEDNKVRSREKQQIKIDGQQRWFNLHKASIEGDGTVIMLEDQTEPQMLEQKLIHSERLASIGQLAAGVAHEIGNPVTGVDCLAQELRDYSQSQDAREIADQILEQTKRIGKILHSLVSFAHTGQASEQMTVESVSLYRCTDEAIALLSLHQDTRGIRYINNCHMDYLVSGDIQKLTQVLINLLSNARDASPNNAVVTVNTIPWEHSITLEVTDQGSGISEENQKRLFEPFFTTKGAGKGTGLGLALVYSIIEEHFGTISVRSPVNEGDQGGTCISISLPRHMAELKSSTRRETEGNLVG
ncbi:ATP-binding protein [Sansalvadorimonas sp. 2012CJ34-2]|uniref:histidine kinase n=1 Tax=Parendozoicomonas callyspongiae TaxID=2942213 RepID=A0ABT0PK62_9GAMM|nr:sensor histidine kinase [Sansalvadorimonas sp. 2012CJ34-2]MCL6271770.1 ATP-binding protein [Sansalvadorimonas sp. 2012CJ34-2]